MTAERPSNVEPLRLKRPCPECGRPSSREAYPFCSARCKAVDLNRWLSGAYAIPAAEEEPGEDRPEPGEDRPEPGPPPRS